jgi:prepilin-type N-terminal cleavage/methylation domain-containing protein
MRIRSEDQRAASGARAAFTLIELVVVIAIILVLVAITAAAAGKVLSAQRVSNTKTIIQKIDAEFQKQYAAAVDNAIAEANSASLPQSIIDMSSVNGVPDLARARVIWVKLRLRAEFPSNLSEAISWPSANWPPQNQNDLPGQSAYGAALNGTGLYGVSPPATKEAGICLLLALSIGRRGSVLNRELLGGLTLANAGAPGVNMIVDGWGTPLAFYRWPINAPFTVSSSTQAIDPLDPTGRLMDPTWNNDTNFNGSWPNNGVAVFEQLCHSIHTGSGGGYTPLSFNLVPTIASAGPDRSLGLDPATMAQVDSTSNDNIYNHQ